MMFIDNEATLHSDGDESSDEQELKGFKLLKNRQLADDKYGRLVFLPDSQFSLQMTQEKYPSITFHEQSGE